MPLPAGGKGSAITGAFTVPTSGGVRRAWRRSSTGSHVLASEDSSGTGRTSPGSHTDQHPRGGPAAGHPCPCRTARPHAPPHRRAGHRAGTGQQDVPGDTAPRSEPSAASGGTKERAGASSNRSQNPAAPREQHSQPVAGTRGPAPHQHHTSTRWEAREAIAALITGPSCCLDLG